MSVDDLVATLDAVLARLPPNGLVEAARLAEEARDILAEALSGAGDCEAVATLTAALEQHSHVTETLARAMEVLRGYRLKIHGTGDQSAGVPIRGSRSPTMSRIEDLRADLPAPVPKPNPGNRKTHGRWIDASGAVRRAVSGEDTLSLRAWELFVQAGVPADRRLAITTHVEVKVAAEMVTNGQRHAELVVNNRPCVGPLGCDSLLPVLLPEGYSVTVYGPGGYRRVFEGGEQW